MPDALTMSGGEKTTNLKCLERASGLMQNTYALVQQSPGFEALTAYLDANYREHDQESYDCHSFMLSVARRELGADVPVAPHFVAPDREAFSSESEWAYAFSKNIREMLERPDGKEYVGKLQKLTEDMYENSEHIDIPHTTIRGLASVEECEQMAKNIAKEVVQKITSSPVSRILLISNGGKQDFYDVHSSIILGPDKSGEDLLVLEKLEIGSSVDVRKLSEVIRLQSLSHFEDLELNICHKAIHDL